jgi:hypothetical protein
VDLPLYRAQAFFLWQGGNALPILQANFDIAPQV